MSTTTETPTIRSTYTDDQLRDALITATELRERIFIRGTVGADGAYGSQHWSEDQIADLHAILNVLEALDDDDTGEGDQRVNAWDILIKHPYFETCFDQDVSLLEAMLQKLDKLTQPPTASADDTPSRVWEEAKDIQDVRRGDEIRIETKGFVGYYSSPVAKVDLSKMWLYFRNGDFYAWDDRDHVSRLPAPVVNPDPKEHQLIRCDVTGKILMATPEGYYISEHGLTWPPSNFEEWTPMNVVEAESDG